jgi:hypothetical protein
MIFGGFRPERGWAPNGTIRGFSRDRSKGFWPFFAFNWVKNAAWTEFIHHRNRCLNDAWRRRGPVILPLKITIKITKIDQTLSGARRARAGDPSRAFFLRSATLARYPASPC